jgi:hypothetical protein
VGQRARLEDLMAHGYIVVEIMQYLTEYSQKFHLKGPKLISEVDFEKFEGIILSKARSSKVMLQIFRD